MNAAAPHAVALVSGGLDSMVAAARAREAGFRLLALTVDYGQRHRVELEAARRIASMLGAERHVVLPLDLRAFGGSALTDDIDVPRDGAGGNSIPVTYVPARNTIFLSLALGWAEAEGGRDLFIGVNALDYSGYPDCRPDFISAFETLAGLATKAGVEGKRFTVHAPLLHLGKADIVREAARLELDAGISWSCYDPVLLSGEAPRPGAATASADQSALHCGRCESCGLRARGFAEAGIADPTAYAVRPAGAR